MVRDSSGRGDVEALSVAGAAPEHRRDQGTPASPSRRRFLRNLGVAGVASAVTSIGAINGLGHADADAQEFLGLADTKSGPAAKKRRAQAYKLRRNAARDESKIPLPQHPNNGDEQLYSNRIGNFSKGLPHDGHGIVDPNAYASLLNAIASGAPAAFAAIPMGGSVPLVNPQSGLAYDMEGTDSHQLAIPPAPALASAWRAAEAVEVYWQALLRDLPFSQYATSPMAQAAVNELNSLTDFRGPRDPATNQVTPATLFRGFTHGDLIGPYISQFLYPTLAYGAAQVVQQFQTDLALADGGVDYMIDFPSWLAVQNGQWPFAAGHPDPTRRYIRAGRDMAAYVHVDVLFEAYLNACLYLVDIGAPLNPGNPYLHSANQQGFGTFGVPHMKAMVAEIATRALKAVWYQKWFVHRTLRPEAFGGLVHLTLSGTESFPLHSDVLNSSAVANVYSRNGTYLLPHAFPEGCPQHPSYGQGHATVAGACATIVKAFFDDTWVLPNPVVPSDDGLSLLSYTGPDAGQITVGGEMNKIAANIAIGRNHAAVHWRSDYQESMLLGEAIAISVLRDQRRCYNEDFGGFTFTRFDGTTITV
jgi:hypothetical protein